MRGAQHAHPAAARAALRPGCCCPGARPHLPTASPPGSTGSSGGPRSPARRLRRCPLTTDPGRDTRRPPLGPTQRPPPTVAASPVPEPEPVAATHRSPSPHPPRRSARGMCGGLSLVDVRRLCPTSSSPPRPAAGWRGIHLTQNCQVSASDGNVLNPRLRQRRSPATASSRADCEDGGPPGGDRRGRSGLEDRDDRRHRRPASRGRRRSPRLAADPTTSRDWTPPRSRRRPLAPPTWVSDDEPADPAPDPHAPPRLRLGMSHRADPGQGRRGSLAPTAWQPPTPRPWRDDLDADTRTGSGARYLHGPRARRLHDRGDHSTREHHQTSTERLGP